MERCGHPCRRVPRVALLVGGVFFAGQSPEGDMDEGHSRLDRCVTTMSHFGRVSSHSLLRINIDRFSSPVCVDAAEVLPALCQATTHASLGRLVSDGVVATQWCKATQQLLHPSAGRVGRRGGLARECAIVFDRDGML